MILDGQRVNINEVAHHLCISHSSAHGIVEDRLGFINSVQDEFQNNSQESKSSTV
jgi:hypothetical protein